MFITSVMRFAVIAAVVVSCNNDEDDNNIVSQTDMDFAMQTSVMNTAEVQAGALAATKATDTAIRSLGQMMVTEHTAAQNDLKAAGSALNIYVADSVDAEHLALMAQLSALTAGLSTPCI